jgi:cellulose synthase/poly-beta-1,6-N-acetylglucosamine synthase-like glycosyltransferase
VTLTETVIGGVINFLGLSPETVAFIGLVLDKLHFFFDSTFHIFLYAMMVFTSVYVVLSVYLILSRKKSSEEQDFIPEKAPFVTVQIPTRNEVIALRCAKRCIDFDYPKDRYEIIIGDDSNDPDVSRQLVEFAESNEGVRVIKRLDNVGFKPGNLNNMLKYSNGEVLVIFDSDFTPGKDFLRRIVTPFIHDPDVSAVQAKWNFSNFNRNFVTVMASTIVYIFHHVMLSFMSKCGSGSLCGSAEAVRKSDLVKLGGWKSGSLTGLYGAL